MIATPQPLTASPVHQGAASVAARVVDVSNVYGPGEAEVRAFGGVSVELGAARFTAITGPSGSGNCPDRAENRMNDGIVNAGDARRTGVTAAMCVVALLGVALASSVDLAFGGTGFDLVTTSSQMTWGAGGYTVAIAALVLLFAGCSSANHHPHSPTPTTTNTPNNA